MISRSCARGRTTTNPGPLAQGRPGSGGVKMGSVRGRAEAMRSILLAIKANIQLVLIASLFLHHNQEFGMMAVHTGGQVRDQTEISMKAGLIEYACRGTSISSRRY